AMNALQQWHLNDPVSQKEIDRNNAVYDIQGNRNPFIDCPSFVGRIWDGPAASQPIYDECFPAPATCDPPTNVTATAHERSISISWTTVPAALSYSIFVNDQLLDEDITTTNYDDTNLSEGTYCYSIVAFCSNEESDPSNDACATITIDNIVENTDFANIYPNPVSSTLTIQTNNACHVSLYDIFGRCILQQYISDTETLLDMQSLPQGIYILKMQSVNSELIYSYKIVK
ncbi:MAG: endonuclease, partial [Bacteroidales bacterium]|nr:endonuclease [Bacteroidales bacterium]